MNNKKYNTIFIGTPDFSVPTLQALISDERFSVLAVVTAPDAKVGRKQILTPPPVKVEVKKHSIPVLQPENIINITDEIQELNPDVIITIAYGQILPPKILKIPKHGCLNLHASLLPKYRGASPIQTAIANGETETGVTLMKMDEGLDTGDIIAQEKIKIDKLETGETLHDKLAKLSAGVLKKYLLKYLLDELKPQAQDDSRATLAPKLTREHGRIDWKKTAKEIERLVRAYTPWPGTYTHLRQGYDGQAKLNDKVLKIISTGDVVKINKYKTGYVFLYDSQIAVQCGQDALIIKQLQLAGKKIMSAKEFLVGNKNVVGSILK